MCYGNDKDKCQGCKFLYNGDYCLMNQTYIEPAEIYKKKIGMFKNGDIEFYKEEQ